MMAVFSKLLLLWLCCLLTANRTTAIPSRQTPAIVDVSTTSPHPHSCKVFDLFNVCENNGLCNMTSDRCDCPPEYIGAFCSHSAQCPLDACSTEGTYNCTVELSPRGAPEYTCHCKPNYIDWKCSLYNYCEDDVCKNGVHCYNTTTHRAYVGYHDKTVTDRTCQRWDSQSPHQHDRNSPYWFPDFFLANNSNYCRDPDNTGFLWCYTTDANKRWETCGMSRCECYKTTSLKEYVGKWNVTTNGRQCQRWDTTSPHSHTLQDASKYPDYTLADAANYCRDPDDSGYLWCYTMDSNLGRESCGVDKCKFSWQAPSSPNNTFHSAADLPEGSNVVIIVGVVLGAVILLLIAALVVVFVVRGRKITRPKQHLSQSELPQSNTHTNNTMGNRQPMCTPMPENDESNYLELDEVFREDTYERMNEDQLDVNNSPNDMDCYEIPVVQQQNAEYTTVM